MDKCIKVELPTGHVLLENLKPATEESKSKLVDYIGHKDFVIKESKFYEGWIMIVACDVGNHFKAIAQYGDEFPV